MHVFKKYTTRKSRRISINILNKVVITSGYYIVNCGILTDNLMKHVVSENLTDAFRNIK